MCAGARRFMFNHHIGRVKKNLDVRRAERAAGLASDEMTGSLSWSKVSFINECNAWKNGQLDSSPVNDDGTCGLHWRRAVPADIFECASADASQALNNFSNSVKGVRKGKKAGFAKFKSRHHSTPSFRLRSKSKPGATAPVRVAGPHSLHLSRLGDIRVQGCTKELRRMVTAGRFHIQSVTVKFEQGKWWISVEGVAAIFNHQLRSPNGRHAKPTGVDRGVKDLAVFADADGDVLHVVKAVRSLQNAQAKLKRANQAMSRAKTGSNGHAKAQARLVRVHARAKWLRQDAIHKASHWAATNLTRLTVEDLNIAGMIRLRALAKTVSDAAMGELGRQLRYKSAWYGLELIEADRWFASTKTCSGCGNVKAEMTLDERTYRCYCGTVLDRDVNAAINLARWPDRNNVIPPLQVDA